MAGIRKPFQGITNIVRFNWHFYLLAAVAVLLVLIFHHSLNDPYRFYTNILCILIIGTTLISLLVSFFVYDLSGLYTFNWLDKIKMNLTGKIININAGFDETSVLLHSKYPGSELQVFDFYDSEKHTEVSIKRARNAYPPYKNTKLISTSLLPLQDSSADNIFVILAAHEIRSDEERVEFFKEIHRVVKHPGKVIVTEHLRDFSNFLAYNIGFFHFLSKSSWLRTFKNANLRISEQVKITPFITTFILETNGASS